LNVPELPRLAGAGFRCPSCPETPEARRQAAVPLDLARRPRSIPAQAGASDRRGLLDAAAPLVGSEQEEAGATLARVLEGERHLVLDGVPDLGAQHARLARERRARIRPGEQLAAVGAIESHQALGRRR